MIELVGVSFRFPDGTLALEDVELSVPDGEFLVLCGANGCGKTTLLRLMNGLLQPSRGRVSVDGQETTGSPVEIRRKVGLVFQDPDSQIIGETVADDVAFGPENLGLAEQEVQERVTEALQVTGLAALSEKPCYLLSGGEKRRLALAGVLAMRPSALALDEPLANLDDRGTREILARLVLLHGEGRTIVVATHDVEKVVAHADRLAVLEAGHLRLVGVPAEILGELSRFGVRPPCATLLGHEPESWLRE